MAPLGTRQALQPGVGHVLGLRAEGEAWGGLDGLAGDRPAPPELHARLRLLRDFERGAQNLLRKTSFSLSLGTRPEG